MHMAEFRTAHRQHCTLLLLFAKTSLHAWKMHRPQGCWTRCSSSQFGDQNFNIYSHEKFHIFISYYCVNIDCRTNLDIRNYKKTTQILKTLGLLTLHKSHSEFYHWLPQKQKLSLRKHLENSQRQMLVHSEIPSTQHVLPLNNHLNISQYLSFISRKNELLE